ncbi:MAG: Maf family protein [Candidatus Sulfotelmatobacter sp.]
MLCLFFLQEALDLKIVLASESPFRKRAMDLLGLPYETRPSRIDEKAIRDDDPTRLTRKLAEAKAHKIAEECPDAVIVSGDAVAAKRHRIFEKPRSKAEAASFLKEFSGSQFQFVTSIAVLNAQTRRMLSTVETLDISFRPLLDRESSSTSINTTCRITRAPSKTTQSYSSPIASPEATTSEPRFLRAAYWFCFESKVSKSKRAGVGLPTSFVNPRVVRSSRLSP